MTHLAEPPARRSGAMEPREGGKPVELAVRAIECSSRPDENVLDLFGGSGSTPIACEQTGRRASLMEVDALSCEVIVPR
jgi:DNA modification methylase